ncbi:DinB family protein [Flavobacteriaceae sp. LMIT009]
MSNSQNTESKRAAQLADRILQGANMLLDYSNKLTDTQWQTPVIGDGRSIGVVVHHVASVYPIEVELAQVLASGNNIEGATKEVIDNMNAEHAENNSKVGKEETLELLKQNSENASKAVRKFTDQELDNSGKVSLNADAPLTAQFFIEDHALRHSFHHLAKIKETIKV